MLDDFSAPRPHATPKANFTVTELVAEINDLLIADFDRVTVIGEVASFKINQGKWVFFDLKDEATSLGCFLPLSKLRTPLEDGMKVIVKGCPSVTKWGKFSFTVETITPAGEGSLRRAFELLRAKLTREGLFDPARKRPLPDDLQTIGVISSIQAAGYADFIKIINERWSGLKLLVAHTGVQGAAAADQIIRALNYFNEHGNVDLIAIIRGGGSADDLAVFNDESLVRVIAASKIPVITGIGHEVDTSLADLAADLVGSTPSNVAEIITADRAATLRSLENRLTGVRAHLLDLVATASTLNRAKLQDLSRFLTDQINHNLKNIQHTQRLLDSLNPEQVLGQGYAIIRGTPAVGQTIELETARATIVAEVKTIKEKNV